MSKKRGGRRTRSHRTEHEYLFTRWINIHCPVHGHKLGYVFQDVARTEVWPEHIDDHLAQNLSRDAGRLQGACVRCSKGGVREHYEVRWERVERLLERMRNYGPSIVTTALSARAFEQAALPPPPKVVTHSRQHY